MSEVAPSPSLSFTAPPAPSRSFVGHAKLIGILTLVSRFTGLAREIVAGHYLGTGLVASAFTVAFTIPNLFRKLFGEGALSAAFIPLYAQAVKEEREGGTEDAGTRGRGDAGEDERRTSNVERRTSNEEGERYAGTSNTE